MRLNRRPSTRLNSGVRSTICKWKVRCDSIVGINSNYTQFSRSQFVNGRQIDSYLDPALGWQREKAITPIFPSYSRQEWLSAEHSLDSVIE
jgi:hypothetical protein